MLDFCNSIINGMEIGADEGAAFGKKMLGIPGQAVGFVVGGACGAIKGFFDRIFG